MRDSLALIQSNRHQLARLPARERDLVLSIVLEPAHDFVIVNEAPGAKRFVVMQICYPGHLHAFSDNRAKYVTIGAPTVDRDVLVGGVNRRNNLPIAAKGHCVAGRRSCWWLNAKHLQ